MPPLRGPAAEGTQQSLGGAGVRPSAEGPVARLDRAIQYLLAALVGLSLLAMVTVVIVLVVARFVLGISLFWGEELARYLMIYMGFIGGAVALRAGQHPRLGIFAAMLPAGARRMLGWLIDILMLVTLAVLFYQGLDIALNEGRMRTPALRIPYLWVFLAVPIGAAAMLIQLLLGRLLPNVIPVNEEDDIEEVGE